MRVHLCIILEGSDTVVNNMRTEMKIGLLLIALSGVENIFFNTPEFIVGMTFALGITFEIIGGIKEESYQRLKQWKKSLWKVKEA